MKAIRNVSAKSNVETGAFPLFGQPVSYQLTIHFNNLITYALESYHKDDVVTLFTMLCDDPAWASQCLAMRNQDPVKFRAAQMIEFYGAKAILSHVKAVYSQRITV